MTEPGADGAPQDGHVGPDGHTGPNGHTAPDGASNAGSGVGQAGGTPATGYDAELGHSVRSGLRWSFATQLGVRAMSFGAGIVMFRVLVPAQFGTYALALAVLTVLLSVNDLGQDMAVVAWNGPDLDVVQRTAVTIAAGFSTLLFVGVTVAAPAIARASDSPDATGLIRLLAVLLLIDGWIAIPRARMFRAMDQRSISFAELASIPVSLSVSVVLVTVVHAGAWGPTIGTVAGATVSSGYMLVRAPARPRPGFRLDHARSLLGFGIPGSSTMTVETALLNIDALIVGRQLGPTALGFYALAFNVSSWPSSTVTNAVRKVSVPAFSRLNAGDQAWREPFQRAFTLLLSALLPVGLGMIVLAEPLVRLVYGAKSLPAAPVLRWLVVLGITRVVLGFLLDVLIALGRPGATLRCEAAWLAAAAPALWFGAQLDGIRGVAIGHVVAAVGVAAPLFVLESSRAGVEFGAASRPLVRPLLAATVSAAFGLWMVQWGTPLVSLFATGSVVLVLYLLLAGPRTQLQPLLDLRRMQPAAPLAPAYVAPDYVSTD